MIGLTQSKVPQVLNPQNMDGTPSAPIDTSVNKLSEYSELPEIKREKKRSKKIETESDMEIGKNVVEEEADEEEFF